MLNAIPRSASWELSQLPLLVERVAAACGAPGTAAVSDAPAADNDVAEWIEASCSRPEVDARACHAPLRDVEAALVAAAPALLRLCDGHFIGLIDVRGRRARLATRDSGTIDVPLVA